MARFAGLERAHGTYDLSNVRVGENSKLEGRAKTKAEPVTTQLWENHLAGVGPGLGIIPIRDGNTVMFGGIDIDNYQLDLNQLAARLHNSKIPLIVIRSKSGGAHVYCFCKVPVMAASMKSKLSEVAAFLGYGGSNSEIFPKQSQILSENGDIGNWLSMPYYNGTRGMRYAVGIDGNALSPEAFLIAAEALAVGPEWFSQLLVVSDDFEDGPPCLQALAQIGYQPGTRNDGLFSIGVYLRKSRPDSWEGDLDKYNHKFMSPPLLLSDVQGVVKSLKRKEYAYPCQKQPISQHCNSGLCRTRKWGVGSGMAGRFPSLGGLTKLDTKPPIWFWTIEGTRVELTTQEIQDQRLFKRKCMDYLNMNVSSISSQAWDQAVEHALESLTVVEAPKDASPEGQFWEMLEKFCTRRAQALTIDEIVLGKPFTNDGRTYFKMQDLLSFLTSQKFFEFKSTKIASMLRDVGAEHHFKILKGCGVNYWSIVQFAQQNEAFSVPKDLNETGAAF